MASRGIKIAPSFYANLSTDTDLDLKAGVKYTIRNKSASRLYLIEILATEVGFELTSEEADIRRDFVDAWETAIVSFTADSILRAWYDNVDGGTISMVEV